jgi:SAM-dependent methyltransferase
MSIIQTTKTLRPREKNDHYPTPIELCRAGVDLSTLTSPRNVLDPGCGTGVWGQAAREIYSQVYIDGVDISPQIEMGKIYNAIFKQDFLEEKSKFNAPYDLIVGNPPYRLAEEFIWKSHSLLRRNGDIIFLLRLNFLEGQKRGGGLWKEFPPSEVWVLSKRPSFTGDRRTDATAYMLIKWCSGLRNKYPTQLYWLDWNYNNED